MLSDKHSVVWVYFLMLMGTNFVVVALCFVLTCLWIIWKRQGIVKHHALKALGFFLVSLLALYMLQNDVLFELSEIVDPAEVQGGYYLMVLVFTIFQIASLFVSLKDRL